VIRESGGDRSAVTGGTVVLSDRIVVQVTSEPGATFLDRMIALVEGANRQKTPNEVALDILIAGLTLILLVAVVTLQPMAVYDHAIQSTAVLVALFVCLAPTTIGGLLSAIGIAGMDRMVQRNVLAMSGRAVEAAGDGTNDAHALAQADVGLAMNTGTQAAKEAGNMVDLDSNPTKLIEVVEVAKQLLITRGSLTTFSIANDVAKYFAIIPAMFDVAYPRLRVLNVMHLDNPHTAILAAVIYNALIIPALIPLALRGVRFRPLDGAAILRRNSLIYGVGGIVAPFVLIKVFDLLLAATGLH
jgi:high-affinity K+ transport system ATPase subunit B